MTNYPYRYVVTQPPDSCSLLLRDAFENQHQHGVEIKPGWKHTSRMVMGSMKGTKLVLHSGRLCMNAHAAILYADILSHVNGSEIVGEFRINPGIRFIVWFLRIFISLLFLVPVTILVLAKFRDPQALPGFGLSMAILIMIAMHFSLMFGLNRLLNIPLEDVRFIHQFIERATSSSNSNEIG